MAVPPHPSPTHQGEGVRNQIDKVFLLLFVHKKKTFLFLQNALLITPPSTRNAAPVVADASGLAM